jgi:hypothetical protein
MESVRMCGDVWGSVNYMSVAILANLSHTFEISLPLEVEGHGNFWNLGCRFMSALSGHIFGSVFLLENDLIVLNISQNWMINL